MGDWPTGKRLRKKMGSKKSREQNGLLSLKKFNTEGKTEWLVKRNAGSREVILELTMTIFKNKTLII